MKFRIDIEYGVPVLVREIAFYFAEASKTIKMPLSEVSFSIGRNNSVLPCIVEEYLHLMSDNKALNLPFLQKEMDTRKHEESFSFINSMRYFTVAQKMSGYSYLLLLTNGTVCFSQNKNTGILPHNLKELCNAGIALLDNPNASNDEISEVIKGPDLPAGGVLICEKDLYNAKHSKVINRASIQVCGNRLRVVELPYTVQDTTVVEEIVSLSRSGKLDAVQDIYNISSEEKIDILIDVKRETNIEKLLELLYRKTSLQREIFLDMHLVDTKGENTYSLKEMLQEFVSTQLNLGLDAETVKDSLRSISEKYGRPRMTKIINKETNNDKNAKN